MRRFYFEFNPDIRAVYDFPEFGYYDFNGAHSLPLQITQCADAIYWFENSVKRYYKNKQGYSVDRVSSEEITMLALKAVKL